MSYDCTKTVCCQEKYILGELLVRMNWEVIGKARFTEVRHSTERDRVVLAADAGDT